ncbi:MAG: hypothetical protein MZV64_19550 [Ignavibacteriales bacterium]|nr:hypothetical protein [Ignavibacteriales bacterium]
MCGWSASTSRPPCRTDRQTRRGIVPSRGLPPGQGCFSAERVDEGDAVVRARNKNTIRHGFKDGLRAAGILLLTREAWHQGVQPDRGSIHKDGRY